MRRLFRRQKTNMFTLPSRSFYLCVVVGSMVCLGVGCLYLKGSSSSAKEDADSSVCADTSALASADTNEKQHATLHNSGQTGEGTTSQGSDMSYGDTSSVDVRHVLRSGVGSVTTRHDGRVLPVVAREILQNYQVSHSCVLVSSGYLDLCGNAWMCMVFGGAWVEMCLITDKDRTSSEVHIVRMTSGEWEAAYGSAHS